MRLICLAIKPSSGFVTRSVSCSVVRAAYEIGRPSWGLTETPNRDPRNLRTSDSSNAMKQAISILSVLLLAVFALPATAQEHDNSAYLADVLSDFDQASDKLNQLAEAIPAETYGWRPSEGVRSVSESLMHVVLANYYFTSALGHEHGEEMPEESVADKDAVMAHLATSQAHFRMVLDELSSADLSATMEMFGGQEMSVYRVLMIATGHSHEHLGQMIAYARSNNIAPPWSGGGG